jgi:hypothetical protein
MAGTERICLVRHHDDCLADITTMAQVHTFALESTLYSDTRLPLQYLGGSRSPAPRQVELSTLLAWIQANMGNTSPMSVSSNSIDGSTTSIAVASGKMVSKIVVIGSTSGTFSLGTSAGGTQILDGETFDTDGAVYTLDRYFHTGGTLHFSGYGAATLTVKLILIAL